MSGELPFTGERFIPGTPGEIWIEHWHRYHFASRWAAGQRVLDVACGEGYGCALLARTAREVTGVDVSAAAVAHARAQYRDLANARFVEASCTQHIEASSTVMQCVEGPETRAAMEEPMLPVARGFVKRHGEEQLQRDGPARRPQDRQHDP